jgi:hypothetical protein
MTPTQLSALLVELLSLPAETEWVEWKHNNDNPDMIAERIKEYTEKDRELWAILSRKPFETGIAKADVDGPDHAS